MPVRTPKSAPSDGFSPYAPSSSAPEIRITPKPTTGIAATAVRGGRSPRTAHARTTSTGRRPRAVAGTALFYRPLDGHTTAAAATRPPLGTLRRESALAD